MNHEKETPSKTKADSAIKVAPEPDLTWLWVKSLVASIKYLIEDGRLGLLAVVFLTVIANVEDIVAIFHFPPEDKPFSKFLIFGVALTVWDVTRARIKNSEDSWENKSLVYRKRRSQAVALFVVSLFLFCGYYTMSGNWVSTEQETAVAGGSSETKHAPPRVFFHPLKAPAEFQKSILNQSGLKNYASAFRFEVDNDPDWLGDKLDEYFWPVMATKLLLLVLILFATAALVGSATVISSLPKYEQFG